MTCPFAHNQAPATLSDDLMCQEVIDDPHSYYRGLREAEPIHWNERWGGWVLTGYDDVVKVLRDREHFSSDRMGYLARELPAEKQADYKPIFDVLSQWMVFRDPPDHTRLRILLNKFFTPRAVEAFRPRVRGIVNDLLAGSPRFNAPNLAYLRRRLLVLPE